MGKVLPTFFRVIVFALMTYFVVKQAVRYVENNDAPSFAYKKFLDTPQDNYPIFTFCIEEDDGIYDDNY